MRPTTFLMAACLMGPNVATAGMLCSFATECMEGESCLESGFTLEVDTGLRPGALAAEGGLPTGDTIVTDSETIPVTWAGAGPALAAFGPTGSSFVMLSVAPDGAARYTAHLSGADLSLTYIGTCEGN